MKKLALLGFLSLLSTLLAVPSASAVCTYRTALGQIGIMCGGGTDYSPGCSIGFRSQC